MFKEIVIKPAKKGYVVIIDGEDIRVTKSAYGMRKIFEDIENECRDEDLRQVEEKKIKKTKV